MKHSEQQAKISEALSLAQSVMEGAKRDSTNPFFRSKYADLASCWEACRHALTSNGIAVLQGNSPHEGGVLVTTRLTHKSGEWIEDDGLFIPATKADAQGHGSALTFGRRYGLCAMVGIAPEDDDGNAAAKTAPRKDYKPGQAYEDGGKAFDKPIADPMRDKLYARLLETAVSGGKDALKDAWEALSKAEQTLIGKSGLDSLKAECKA